jgi:hypothetical protein
MPNKLYERAKAGQVEEIVAAFRRAFNAPVDDDDDDEPEEWDPMGSARSAYRYMRVAESYGHEAAGPYLTRLLEGRFKKAPRGALGEVEFMLGVHQLLGLDNMPADVERGFRHLERAAKEPNDLYADAVDSFREDLSGDARKRFDELFPVSRR